MVEEDIQALIGTVLFILLFVCLGVGLYPSGVQGTVAEVSWKTVSEVESFLQVRHTDEHSHPSDAYAVSSRRVCTNYYNSNTKSWDQDCHTEYSYTVDRWVHTRDVVTTGLDRNPYFPEFELSHVEIGYGNERLGPQKVYYIITGKFGSSIKSCSVGKDLWDKSEEGMSLKTKKSLFNGLLCSFKVQNND